jgi:hypothetical protein
LVFIVSSLREPGDFSRLPQISRFLAGQPKRPNGKHGLDEICANRSHGKEGRWGEVRKLTIDPRRSVREKIFSKE